MILDTPRLRLRPFRPEDAPFLAAFRAEPGALRFMPGGDAAAARAGADAAFLADIWARAWTAGHPGYAPWAAVERNSGALVGQVGLRWLPWDGGVTEVLWMLGTAYRGRGLATEGARAALGWGFRALGLGAVDCFAMPNNGASLAVARRLGMRLLGPVEELGVLRFRARADD